MRKLSLTAPLRILFQNIPGRHRREKRLKARKLLDDLNMQLNRARSYGQVIDALSAAFGALFSEARYAFYVRKNKIFKLTFHDHIQDSSPLSAEIKTSFFNHLDSTKLSLPVSSLHSLPQDILDRFIQGKLSKIFIFHGHERVFAMLFIDELNFKCLQHTEVFALFQRIQQKAGFILENKSLLQDLQKKHEEIRKLFEISHRILSAFNTKKVLDFILESLNSLIDFDAAAIFLVDKTGKRLLNTSHTGYEDNALTRLPLKVGQGSCGWVVQTGKIDVIDDVRESEHYFNLRPQTRSQISLPLNFDNQVLGVLCLESNRAAFFNDLLVEELQLFGHLAALAIHNARQLKVLLDKRALEIELINAGKVQEHLLVQRFPSIRNLKITAVNRPSILVSGDLYDVIKYNPYTAGIAIGDVSGKGAAAALMMTLILAGLRSHKKSFLTACDIVYQLNNLLYESTSTGNYATFFYAILSTEENRLIYTNAGHNPPLFIKADGQIVRLEEGGIVLGFQADWYYKQQEISFEPGDLLVAYTDGVTETSDDNEQEFGEERLLRLVLKHHRESVFVIKERILEAINNFSGEESNRDDVTLVVCKYETAAE